MVGPITSARLSGEAKLVVVRAIAGARDLGAPLAAACRLLELPRDRYYRWVGERDPAALTVADLTDRSSAPLLVANRLTVTERRAMLAIAADEAHATERHRKLAHLLGREQGVFVSPSSMLRRSGTTTSCRAAAAGALRSPGGGAPNLSWTGRTSCGRGT